MGLPDFPRQHKPIVEKHLAEIEFAFKNIPNFTKEFGSTARRINTIVNNPNLSLIFGHRSGVNFDKLIADGWVILVNASTGSGLGKLQTRLLATIIVNQIIETIERLRHKGFNKPYYLYLDEAEQYATDKLIEVLDTKRNIKLRMILSNHFPSQFKPNIKKSVENQTKTQIAFYVHDNKERRDVASQFYGGDLKPDDVEYALRSQQKRQAVMKLGKHGSVIAKTHDVLDKPVDNVFLSDLLLSRNYATINEILDDYEARFPNSPDSKSTESHKVPNGNSTSSDDVSRGVQGKSKSDIPAGSKKPSTTGKRKTLKI
jgi:hypothetical protein